ncbi:hypothetical protein [Pseudomonas reidholzensis]
MTLGGYSGHADQAGLVGLRWGGRVLRSGWCWCMGRLGRSGC